jgi:23S rRNA (cytosine1962-C5)-methyltransferase
VIDQQSSDIPKGVMEEKLGKAWEHRAQYHDCKKTDSYRLYHGYGEGIPGLTIDRFGNDLIINSKIALDNETVSEIADFYKLKHPWAHIVLKFHQSLKMSHSERVQTLVGDQNDGYGCATENQIKYLVDLQSVHSNGFYLDARPARTWIQENSREHRVLNLFAHMGALGLAAAKGGAREVVHVDKGKHSLRGTQMSYELNQLKFDQRGFVRGDIYYHLPKAFKHGQKFSGIILDPPPNIAPPPHRPKHQPKGQDFSTLIGMCTALLSNDGWLLCLYHDFSKSHHQQDQEIIEDSNHQLEVFWSCEGESDFKESEQNRKFRASALRFIRTKD